ncbi:MAG: adenine deaminase [Bacteroidota bacterium]
MNSICATLVDIYRREQYPVEMIWEHQRIVSIQRIKTADRLPYLLPGFCDAHVHIESSMLLPQAFAAEVVKHGTIATISDPHEIANVCGIDGVYYMLKNAAFVPVYICFGAPSCVPATAFETAGANLDAEAVRELLKRKDIYYLSEMMNYPGVLYGDDEVLKKITYARELHKPVDGHAPGLTGSDAIRYIQAGIQTDHECVSYEEALFKIQHGMQILIREGSSAKNFEALYPLIDQFPENVMLCTDDCHPDDLVKGHINTVVKRALNKGCDLYHVLRAASINPKHHYQLDYGLLREGDYADFILTRDLNRMQIDATFIKGDCISRANKTSITISKPEPINQFNIDKTDVKDFAIKHKGTPFKIILALDGQLITEMESQCMQADEQGNVMSDIQSDLLKICVVNRYHKQPPAIGFIKNTGLLKGAFASSVAHDSHNIVCVGTNDLDICNAVNAVIAHSGGLSTAMDGHIQILPLPVAGLMSLEDAETVAVEYEKLDRTVKQYGCRLQSPFMTLSFMALLVIPKLKLSDKGLFDVEAFQFVDLQE